MDLPDTRYSLIARLARAEDAEAWNQFVETYEGAVLRYCRARGLQDADAVEIAQEVFLATHRVAGEWEPSGHPGSFRGWLFETARRICLARIRQRAASPRPLDERAMPIGPPAAPPDGDSPDRQRDSQMWAFFVAASIVQKQVQPRTWEAFWKTTVDGIAAREVARQLSMGLGSVYTARCRVMERIRKCVDGISLP